MFIAALFTIARTWKQPKCPSTDEWIKKMWYITLFELWFSQGICSVVGLLGHMVVLFSVF